MKLILMILLLATYAAAAGQTRLQPWPDATVVASEGNAFTVPENTRVWYGKDDRWITRTVSGAGMCTNEHFGFDPYYGVVKVCAVEYPPPYVSPGGLVFQKTTGGVSSRCAPAPKGNGTLPLLDVNAEGVMFAFWCPGTPSDPPRLNLFAVQWWALDTHLVGKLVGVLFSGDPPAAIRALSLERASVPMEQLYGVWGPSEARLLAARPAQ